MSIKDQTYLSGVNSGASTGGTCCLTCGGLIMESGIAYGWAGKVCHCIVPPRIQRRADEFEPIDLDNIELEPVQSALNYPGKILELQRELNKALDALTVSQHSNYNLQQELTETLNVMYEVKCALEVYASNSNWYDRVGNNYITFHDGSDQNLGYGTAREALDLIKSLGEE